MLTRIKTLYKEYHKIQGRIHNPGTSKKLPDLFREEVDQTQPLKE